MSSRRIAKVAEAVREQVSTSILFELKDPRVKHVTVTGVEVSADLRSAKVHVSVMGDEKTQRLTLRGLESARGFLQARLAERVQLRYTPILHFYLDQGVKRSIETSRLLRDVLPGSPPEMSSPEMSFPGTISSVEENAPSDDDLAGDDTADDDPAESADLADPTVFEEGGAGPASPVLPITKSSYERHTENQDG